MFSKCISCVLIVQWTVAHQACLSMEFSRQEYWSGLPFPSPKDHPDTGIKLGSLALQVDSLPSEPAGKPASKVGWLQILYTSCFPIYQQLEV